MVYVTESLRLRGENKYLSSRWIDMIQPRGADVDAEEVITSLFDRAGLVVR